MKHAVSKNKQRTVKDKQPQQTAWRSNNRSKYYSNSSNSDNVWEPKSSLLRKRKIVTLSSDDSNNNILGISAPIKSGLRFEKKNANDSVAMKPVVHTIYFPLELRRKDYVHLVFDIVVSGISSRVNSITAANLYPTGMLKPINYSATDSYEDGDILPFLEQLLCCCYKSDRPRMFRGRKVFAHELKVVKSNIRSSKRNEREDCNARSTYDNNADLSDSELRFQDCIERLLAERKQVFKSSLTQNHSIKKSALLASALCLEKDLTQLFSAAVGLLEFFLDTGGVQAETALHQVQELEAQYKLHSDYQRQRISALQWSDHINNSNSGVLGGGTVKSMIAAMNSSGHTMSVQEEAAITAERKNIFDAAQALEKRMEFLLQPSEVAHTEAIVRLEGYALDVQRMLSLAVENGNYGEAERLSKVEFSLQSALDNDLDREVPSDTDYGLLRLDHINDLCKRSSAMCNALKSQEEKAVEDDRFVGECGADHAASLSLRLSELRDNLSALLVRHSLYDQLPPDIASGRQDQSCASTSVLVGNFTRDSLSPVSMGDKLASPLSSPNQLRTQIRVPGSPTAKRHFVFHKQRPSSAPTYYSKVANKPKSDIDTKKVTCRKLLVLKLPADSRSLLALLRQAGNVVMFRYICKEWFGIPNINSANLSEPSSSSQQELQVGSVDSLSHPRSSGGNIKAEENITALIIAFLRVVHYDIIEVAPPATTFRILKAAGYSADELRTVGAALEELINLNYSLQELKGANCSFAELFMHYSLQEMKSVGFSVKHFKDNGVTLFQIIGAGFGASELRLGGFFVSELYPLFPLKNLIHAGFKVNDFLGVIPLQQLVGDGEYSASELIQGGFRLRDLILLFPPSLLSAAVNDGQYPSCCIAPTSKAAASSQIVAFASADGLLYCADTSGDLSIWELHPSVDAPYVKAKKPLGVWKLGASSRIVRSLLVFDGRCYAAFDQGIVEMDASSGAEIHRMKGLSCYGATALVIRDSHSPKPHEDVSTSPKPQRLLYAGYSGYVKIWDLGTYQEVGALIKSNGGTSSPLAMAIADDLLFACYGDGSIRSWNLLSSEEVHIIALQKLYGAVAASFIISEGVQAHLQEPALVSTSDINRQNRMLITGKKQRICRIFAGFNDGIVKCIDFELRKELFSVRTNNARGISALLHLSYPIKISGSISNYSQVRSSRGDRRGDVAGEHCQDAEIVLNYNRIVSEHEKTPITIAGSKQNSNAHVLFAGFLDASIYGYVVDPTHH